MYAVQYYPPGREDTHVFFCKEKPSLGLSDSKPVQALMVTFVPTNGTFKGRECSIPASHCITGERYTKPPKNA